MSKAASLLVLATFFTGSTALAAKTPETGHALKQQTLRTLDNLAVVTANSGLPSALLDAIESNRQAVKLMGPGDFAALPPVLKTQLGRIDKMSANMKVVFQPRPGQRIIKSSGFPNANYPNVEWDFIVSALENPPGEGSTSSAEDGICNGTGYSADSTFTSLNVALVAEAIKDTAEQACNQSGIGFNASLACIVTDIAFFVAKGTHENFNLCNDFVTAAEVTGSYERLGHIHGDLETITANIQTVKTNVESAKTSILQAISEHDARLETHDTDISLQVSTHDADVQNRVANHDTDIKNQMITHDGDMKALLATLQSGVDGNGAQLELLLARQLEVIRLLHTPQGKRTTDVPACDGAPCAWNP